MEEREESARNHATGCSRNRAAATHTPLFSDLQGLRAVIRGKLRQELCEQVGKDVEKKLREELALLRGGWRSS